MQNSDPASDDEPPYFNHNATLRIHGIGLPMEEITREMGVPPSHQHRKGERRSPRTRPYPTDAWHLRAPVPEERGLTEHLRVLWKLVEPSAAWLKSLDADVDVFCGYSTNEATAGCHIEPDALRIFTELDVPFSLSIIVDRWLGEYLAEPTVQ